MQGWGSLLYTLGALAAMVPAVWLKFTRQGRGRHHQVWPADRAVDTTTEPFVLSASRRRIRLELWTVSLMPVGAALAAVGAHLKGDEPEAWLFAGLALLSGGYAGVRHARRRPAQKVDRMVTVTPNQGALFHPSGREVRFEELQRVVVERVWGGRDRLRFELPEGVIEVDLWYADLGDIPGGEKGVVEELCRRLPQTPAGTSHD